MCNNKEEQGLGEFEDEDERQDIIYIPFLFVTFPQKESNCPTDMGTEIRSLNHLIYLLKIG